MTKTSYDVAALTAGITELRVAAETVRTAGIGLRCPDLSLFGIAEQLWLFSARIESLVRNLLAGDQHRARLITNGSPRIAALGAERAEMVVALDLPVISSYSPTPGHPLAARLDELRLAADMIVSIARSLGNAAVDDMGIPLLGVGSLTDLVLDLHRDMVTLNDCDPDQVVAQPADWDKL
ncbi:hypothetical protein NJBCHELONAE_43280 [Mycobacteroides chelonae]|uniref:hypothetical protein n=1 Tax=Mycobacteroides chelonae TaxID=1774 RepID=UPI0021DCAA8B|nr:hypothetical protein [Mycobacteroides chelonae]GLE59017.1 hypothetical protein NJBCHELONAE_43280 [Mycobacteroides chelonae]